jgi:L-ascorbate metabolism protein UlaG (beta-lactamase superfamily)
METMKVTKLEHATLVLEKQGKTLILDPGFYTRPMDGYQNVVAIVITHNHDDHVHEDQIDRILKDNPDTLILGTQEVVSRLAPRRATAVHHGDFYEVGPFTIEFFGSMHIEIHRSIPLIQNCGVMINDTLFYPGDNYVTPDRKVKYLACPASAPWLKIGDVMDFIAEVKPENCFPTHNIHLSEQGHQLNNGRIMGATEENGGTFAYYLPGETFELKSKLGNAG